MEAPSAVVALAARQVGKSLLTTLLLALGSVLSLLALVMSHPSQVMHRIILGPLAEGLTHVIEQDTKSTPKEDERHVQHDGRHVAVCNDPRGDELAEAIAPQVLVDGDGDEDATGHGLVTVHGVCGCDGWNRSDLNPGTCVSDDDNDL